MARHTLLLMTGIAVGWWLFADTYAHYQTPSVTPSTIRFAHFGSYANYELWRRIIEAFEETQPDSRIAQAYVPGWYGRYDAKIRQQILSGTLPDVVLMQFAPFTGLSRHFAPLERSGVGQLQASVVESFTAADGLLRGMPLAGGNLLIYCLW